MKKVLFSIMMLALATVITTQANAQESKKVTKSKVTWKGYKVTGSHEGSIKLKSGTVMMDGDELKGGRFVIDMTTLESTDLEGEYKTKLDGHLRSDDFFGVEKHPTATLAITKLKKTGKNSYQLTGDLTIKNIKKSIVFPASVYGNKANASIKIDRSKFDVRYGSTSFFDDLKDKAIYDEFDVIVDIEF